MRVESFDLPPCHGKAIHERIDRLGSVMVRTTGQMRVSGGGQDGVVTEDFLDFEEVNAGFDQMGGIAVPPMSLKT